MDSKVGKIHSIKPCALNNGPGARYTVFLEGCNLHCSFCNTPDSWSAEKGKEYTLEALFEDMQNYESTLRLSNGGVTFSGGEPLLQPDFVLSFFMLCKKNNIHTALATSGSILNDSVNVLLEWTDLVILDIKGFNKSFYKESVGCDLDTILNFLDYTQQINKRLWVRYVVIPGITDNPEEVSALSKHLANFKNLERIELIPFQKNCEYKWHEADREYTLQEIPAPSERELLKVLEIFYHNHLRVFIL